ncbi:aminoglycoside adenylyltransferase domain-containing protein [Sphaerisporangium sp. NPDC005289]|uniref:aminoglycoside adenylyltransferase domain-containing protein n=1 Tax=Sphaerisporangium sp. NPDC005289 TaxID=3155247 RepID=UPI0033BBB6C7
MPHQSLDPLVAETVGAYLEDVDAQAPGLVEGLYLVGSVALNDFRPQASDIDFVAVTSARLDAPALATLAGVHDRLKRRRRKPFFDGGYITWDDLAGAPANSGPGASVHEHHFHATQGGSDPVTWHTLAHHGIACRGPEPGEVKVWSDREELIAWTDANLDDYWRRLLDRASRLHHRWGMAMLAPYGTVWVVTGISRMHYTIATGRVISKTGATAHAIEVFPERWHRVVAEAARLRRGEPGRSAYRSPLSRRRDVLAFGDMAVNEAHRLRAAGT